MEVLSKMEFSILPVLLNDLLLDINTLYSFKKVPYFEKWSNLLKFVADNQAKEKSEQDLCRLLIYDDKAIP